MICEPTALEPDDSAGTEPSVGSIENASQFCDSTDDGGEGGGNVAGGGDGGGGDGGNVVGGGDGGKVVVVHGGVGGGGGPATPRRGSSSSTSKLLMVSAKSRAVGGRKEADIVAKSTARAALTAAGVIPTTSKCATVDPEVNRRLITDATVIPKMLAT